MKRFWGGRNSELFVEVPTFLKHFKAFKIPTFGEMINASSKMWCEVFKFMHKDWKLHMICSGETHRWWNQNYLQSRISLSGFCSENILWPKRIKRSWNKNLQRNDPLMLFFVQLVLMDYGRPTVKVSIADNWQGRGWRFGVALNSRWVLWSFLSQINPISWQLMWILSNIFFESLFKKNTTTCEVGLSPV